MRLPSSKTNFFSLWDRVAAEEDGVLLGFELLDFAREGAKVALGCLVGSWEI